MSQTELEQPKGAGNKAAMRSWNHLTMRLSEAFPRNVRNGEKIVLGLIRSKQLRKRG